MHLHFTQSLEPLQGAGLGYSALGLHRGMLDADLQSVLVATREPGFSRNWPGVVQFDRKGHQKLFYAPQMKAWALAQENDFEVFHGHGFYVYPNKVFGGLARRGQRPLVYHVQGFFDPWILKRSRLKKRLVHLLFETANFNHVRVWRALSEKEREQIHAVVGKQANIVVLPNGVQMPEASTPEDKAAARKHYPLKRARRLLFLSRIHPKKGLDLLLKAWSKIDRSLTADWELALFGPDEGGHQAEIEALVKSLALEAACTFYGSVSGEAKAHAFRSSDLFVLPSRSEGFPMAVLEAASYGLPVVQTDECNFPELTRASGAWESRVTVDSLQTALTQALRADALELQQRGTAGRELVQTNYQWSAIAKELDDACKHYC
jgi:poly(glycerol-phosphate) alpha-glucosyltransferase